MTLLTVWADTDADTALLQSTDAAEISEALKPLGVSYANWPLRDVAADAGQDAVLAAYADEVERIKVAEGFIKVDVVGLHPSDDPSWPETAAGARAKFLNEHKHDDDEVRFFVAGAGVFYLHVDGKVFAVLCEAGDLLSVPAGTTHWFDMGTQPSFTAIRFFHDEDGWIGDFTGSTISQQFASFDDLAAVRAGL